MLTDRGRLVLLLGAGVYVVAWAFGTVPLYPVAIGLLLVVVGAAIWVRVQKPPSEVRRKLSGREHLAGEDVKVNVELRAEGFFSAKSAAVREQFQRLDVRETQLHRGEGAFRGGYVLKAVPRGRYRLESSELVLEDPFGLDRVSTPLPRRESILVYPQLVDLDELFSETGRQLSDGRRLMLRRQSGFELHSVRDYEQGESLRRVHWPSTARRGQLMVKELEDSPRDEAAVLLDAEASTVVGRAPNSTFELQVSAAGSLLRAQVTRGRRAALIINSANRDYQPVHSADGDWKQAFELLAAVEPTGHSPVATLLADETGPASRALELTIVTAALSGQLVERILQRTVGRHPASLVYVDPASFRASSGAADPAAAGLLLRLQRGGVPVAVVRFGDDLAEVLRGHSTEVAVG